MSSAIFSVDDSRFGSRQVVKQAVCLVLAITSCYDGFAQEQETLPPLTNGQAATNFEQMWAGFDPTAEPLEVEVLREWEQDHVVLRVVRFRIGVFKGTKATLAAVYGFPKNAKSTGTTIPGLVQIHGGGQFADHKACLANAKRGYATVSIAWAGRISAPGYAVNSDGVKLFWDNAKSNPSYRLTTDWGVLDGYHAPSRNKGNQFPSAKAAAWTLDEVESPRNSGWFLCAMAARRALTFLEQQPEVDAARLGVYGHSMGGKLTVMTSVDRRVKAAAPSCGGISDRYNDSPLFNSTIGDDVSLKHISCPIIFLSPANDFHGRIGNLATAVDEIQSTDWRVTCSPHHNHQDTPPYEVATLLWFDQHLKKTFEVPTTPETSLDVTASTGVPVLTVTPDTTKPIKTIDVYYTLQGKPDETPQDRLDSMHRFWHHSRAKQNGGKWTAELQLNASDKPLWVYANVRYPLEAPVSGAGYYYGSYSADSFNISSLMQTATPEELQSAGVKVTLTSTSLIEDFGGDWKKEWFTYRPSDWARTTNKLNSDIWKAPPGSSLAFEVQTSQANTLVVRIDDHVTKLSLLGDDNWQTVVLEASDFRNFAEQPLPNWDGIRQLKLGSTERLRPGHGETGKPRVVGNAWKGDAPEFRNLRWKNATGESKGK